MDSQKELDLILPFYHPHEGWSEKVETNLRELNRKFAERGVWLHVYLVNDGSPLESYPEESLNRIRQTVPEFDFLSYAPNRGKGYALRYAVGMTRGRWQIYTDGDFPFGIDCVIAAWEKMNSGAQVVMGIRSSDYSSALSGTRKQVSRIVRSMNALFLGLPPGCCDTQAGFKAFHSEGKCAFAATTVDSFLFDTEFILLANLNGQRIESVPLTLRPGLAFSRMGMKVLLRELRNFIRIFFRLRILRRKGLPSAKEFVYE